VQVAWSEIAEVYSTPGVYAWYYSPQLSKHDVVAIRKVHGPKTNGDCREMSLISKFLDKYVYRRVAETPYPISLLSRRGRGLNSD